MRPNFLNVKVFLECLVKDNLLRRCYNYFFLDYYEHVTECYYGDALHYLPPKWFVQSVQSNPLSLNKLDLFVDKNLTHVQFVPTSCLSSLSDNLPLPSHPPLFLPLSLLSSRFEVGVCIKRDFVVPRHQFT